MTVRRMETLAVTTKDKDSPEELKLIALMKRAFDEYAAEHGTTRTGTPPEPSAPPVPPASPPDDKPDELVFGIFPKDSAIGKFFS